MSEKKVINLSEEVEVEEVEEVETNAKVEEVPQKGKIEEVPQKEKDSMKVSEEDLEKVNQLSSVYRQNNERMGSVFSQLMRMYSAGENVNQELNKNIESMLKKAGIKEENFDKFHINIQSGEIIDMEKQQKLQEEEKIKKIMQAVKD